MTDDVPVIEFTEDRTTVLVRGPWSVRFLAPRLEPLRQQLRRAESLSRWDLRGLASLDSSGALLLWRTWGERFPPELQLRAEHRSLFDKWVHGIAGSPPADPPLMVRALRWTAQHSRTAFEHVVGAVGVVGQFVLDLIALTIDPRRIPWREISSTIYRTGAQALPITGLVGILIGVVIAYQSAVQLRIFGGEIFIVDILALSITRELGPILAAILVAGRSGSAMTAQLGVMELNEELDAMTILGISISQRLVFPQVVGLAIALPLLTVWTILLGMIGGMVAANLALGLPIGQFMDNVPGALPVTNLWIGLGKAFVFGALIGFTAAHFGLRVQPNTQSLAAETTKSVVAAITLVIVLNAIFSVILRDVGWT